MELFLLKAFAFLRPLLSIEVEQRIAGTSLFDLVGIAFIAVLGMAFCIRIALGEKQVTWRSLDAWIILYMVWCVAVAVIYPDKTDFRVLIKWVVPFGTYVVAAKIIRDPRDYLRLLSLLWAGHIVPILGSVVVVFLNLDLAIRKVVGATNLPKYEGLYADSGTFGLGMALFVMLGVVYAEVNRSYFGEDGKIGRAKITIFVFVTALALYCLLQSQSRTAQLGLVIFFAVYLYQISKKWLLIGAASLALFVAIMSPLLTLMYYDVIRVEEGERPLEYVASRRPIFWQHNLSEFSNVSPDRWIAGAGIGNLVPMGELVRGRENFWSSHNDFLSVLIHTGIVGLLIFLVLQFVILTKILSLERGVKAAFVALFITVTIMNFASNSYVTRFALAQMYFLVLSYLEFAKTRYATNSKAGLATA